MQKQANCMFLGVFFNFYISFYGQKNEWICQENYFYTFRYLTCSTPSMCASISWMTLASLSASSAERRPLLIFSASRLMSLWASSKYAWSGWSSGVCLSRSLNKQHEHKYTSISLHMSSLLLNTGWGHLEDQQSYILRYLNQQLVSRNPLDRFNHQVTQSLFLLVLTHVLLSEWRMDTRQGEKKLLKKAQSNKIIGSKFMSVLHFMSEPQGGEVVPLYKLAETLCGWKLRSAQGH